jgi:hypothetical protein
MGIVRDLATLFGHLDPLLHRASSIVFDSDSAGVVSVKDVIDDLLEEGSGGVATNIPSAIPVDAGEFVYIDSFGEAQLALADSITTSAYIFAVTKGTDSTSNLCSIKQVGTLTGFLGLTPGTIYYLSDTIAGDITDTPPSDSGDTIYQVGVALTPSTLYVNTSTPPIVIP